MAKEANSITQLQKLLNEQRQELTATINQLSGMKQTKEQLESQIKGLEEKKLIILGFLAGVEKSIEALSQQDKPTMKAVGGPK